MRNKILLGTGIIGIISGVVGLFAADKSEVNSKRITIISSLTAIAGLVLTALVVDDELYPEELVEEDEIITGNEEAVEA